MSSHARPRPSRLDAASAGLWAALVALLAVTGRGNWPYAGHVLALTLGAAVAYVAGRLAGRRWPALWLFAVAAGVGLVVVLSPGIRSGGPLAAPLGYGNANGALLAVGVVAAVGAVASATHWTLRAVAAVLAVALLVVLPATRSFAAVALAIAAAVSSLLVVRLPRGGRVVAGVAGAALASVVAMTVALGLSYDGPGAARATDALSQRRVDLWTDAVSLARDNPVAGVGLGLYPTRSATAEADSDTRFAHSLPLEISAEAGVAAGALVTVLGLSLALAGARGPAGAAAAIGAWAVVVFAAQASVDYTYRFPAVVLPAALVAGLTSARSGTANGRRRDGPTGSVPR